MCVGGQALCGCECVSHVHTVQAKIIAGLAERRGGDLAVGLEMVQEQFQVSLVRAVWGGGVPNVERGWRQYYLVSTCEYARSRSTRHLSLLRRARST